MPPWNSTKAKVQLRLAVQRLRTLQEKKEAQAKAARRDVATLLERNKVETARIKVENIINEDVYLELLELLELYCELLIARFGLLDQNTREPDPAVAEGVCAIIHAAPRTELKELHILRDLLMHKYGREFSAGVMENRDECVSDRVIKKLAVEMPSSALVDAYLTEIAKGYGVQWAQPGESTDHPDDGPEGGAKTALLEPPLKDVPVGVGVGDNLRAAQSPTEEKSVRLPELPPTEDGKRVESEANAAAPPSKPQTSQEDEFTMLAKRFEALKKR
ncbi:regulator of Vps4 activity in the MVB pathway-domain-containing protein [Vararia minispora EC-137]|uniref:Regulator of Vps4 activity in the MVB pathway-domain-containing protein n=1 Tax=Vararia minispora EC-137 TaxID=1314806 RepID=A0ACB8QTG0_9AGAM|nr:regulator of Vps4 activity in the MVB pathway-domain-containing protein [Vararia minispora EC-137]